MKSVSLAMLKDEKAGVCQTPQTLCEEDSLVADAAVLRLPGILPLPGITSSVPIRMSRALNKFCHFGRTSTCPSSMSSVSFQLMGCHAASQFSSPLPNREHTCSGQAVTTVRTILFTVSIFAKGQINEECVLHNFER